jgi:hypothetical protein
MNCANHPDRERIAFCQNCGKPLCAECSRTVGNAVFCEPCLATRLAGSETPTGTPFTNAPPVRAGVPNPALAGLLGLIPGVGAMYNGQFAKGLVHLIIFAILVSLSDTNGIFGLFVAGWVFYQAIEAYQTAVARRDGTPLPNPFGLNDIGEKLGFNKSWSGAAAPPPSSSAYGPGVPPEASGIPFPQTAADTQNYPNPSASTPNWGVPPAGSYSYTAPPVPPSSPYGMPFTPIDPLPPAGDRSSFPMGALFLIGLGLLFFLGSTGLFHHFPIRRLLPFFIIALGVWIFVRKMTGPGFSMADDGSPAYRLRLFRALHSAIWVILVGVLFFLDTFGILSWSHSWPLFIIVAGLMSVFRGSAYGPVPPAPYSYPYPGTANPYPPTAPATPVEPVAPHDEEGR